MYHSESIFTAVEGWKMNDYSLQHKKAWEFDAYQFRVKQSGTPRRLLFFDGAFSGMV